MKILEKILQNPLLKKSLIDSNYYLISQMASKLLTLLVIPVLARIISVEEFGYYDAFLLYSTFFLLFATLGIDSGIGVLIVENKEDTAKLSFYYTFSLATGTLVTLVLFLIGLLVLPFYEFIAKELFLLLFLHLLFSFLSYTAFNFLRWTGKSKVAAIVTFITTTFGVLLGLCFILLSDSRSVYVFLLGLVIGACMGALICLVITRKYLKLYSIARYRKDIKDVFNVSLPFLPNYLINNLLLISDRVLIMHFLGSFSYGQYSMVLRISQIPSFFIQVLNKGFLPVLFHNYDSEQGKLFNRKVFSIYVYAIIPVFFIFIFCSKYLLEIFAGGKYTDVAHLIPVIMLSVMFFGSMGFNGFGFSLKRKTIQITYITLFSILANVGLTLLLIQPYGLSAVAIAIMLASAVSSIIYTYFSEKLYKIGYNLTQMILVFGILSFLAIGYMIAFN